MQMQCLPRGRLVGINVVFVRRKHTHTKKKKKRRKKKKKTEALASPPTCHIPQHDGYVMLATNVHFLMSSMKCQSSWTWKAG